MLKRLRKRLKRDEKGQGMVEYGLILALVSVVAIGALSGIGDSVKGNFGEVKDMIKGPSVITGESIYTESEIDDLVKEGYIPVSNAEDLDKLRGSKSQMFAIGTKWEGEYTSGLDKKYIQVSNIDLSGIDNFNPIGSGFNDPFTGVYDGGEYGIMNLTVNKGGDNYAGLFGYANNATLKNVGLTNINVSGGDYVGGLVGSQWGSSITMNCQTSGIVKGLGIYSGGLVGNQYNASISNSHSTADVSGNRSVGGLVGHQSSSSTTTNSYSLGDILGTGDAVGGLAGSQQGSHVTNSYAMGDVLGTDSLVGGLIGRQNYSSTITNSYSTGDVEGKGISNVGGLVGFQEESSKVLNSYSIGEVKGEGIYVGGLVGHSRIRSSVSDSGWANDVSIELNGIGADYGSSVNVVGQPKERIEQIIKGLVE